MKRYVVWCPANRRGEFNFLCSTEQNWTASKQGAIKEASTMVVEMQHNYNPPLTPEEALEKLGGKPVVYELMLKQLEY